MNRASFRRSMERAGFDYGEADGEKARLRREVKRLRAEARRVRHGLEQAQWHARRGYYENAAAATVRLLLDPKWNGEDEIGSAWVQRMLSGDLFEPVDPPPRRKP